MIVFTMSRQRIKVMMKSLPGAAECYWTEADNQELMCQSREQKEVGTKKWVCAWVEIRERKTVSDCVCVRACVCATLQVRKPEKG